MIPSSGNDDATANYFEMMAARTRDPERKKHYLKAAAECRAKARKTPPSENIEVTRKSGDQKPG